MPYVDEAPEQDLRPAGILLDQADRWIPAPRAREILECSQSTLDRMVRRKEVATRQQTRRGKATSRLSA